MALTVGELLEMIEDLDPNTEVRLATQPNWPFEHSVTKVVTEQDIDAELASDSDDLWNVVWLVEGSQLRYLPGVVRNEAWS